jgi:hypothetical protein
MPPFVLIPGFGLLEIARIIKLIKMKTGILLATLVIAVSANAQSLKETLYSGKLKTDTGTVIRKGEDLSSKIDTARKKPVELQKIKTAQLVKDTSAAGLTGQAVALDSAAGMTTSIDTANAIDPVAAVAGPKDNNKVWKEYLDSLTGTLRTEVLTSKKIKSGTYSVLIEYEIGVDGQITVNNVSCSPESSFLGDQIKERITLTAPQMTPLLNTYGQPRKAIKKQMLTLSK